MNLTVDLFYTIKFGNEFFENHSTHYVCSSRYEHKMYHAMKLKCPCFVEDKAVWGREIKWTINLNNAQLFHDRRQAVKILNMKKRGEFANVEKNDNLIIVPVKVMREVLKEVNENIQQTGMAKS